MNRIPCSGAMIKMRIDLERRKDIEEALVKARKGEHEVRKRTRDEKNQQQLQEDDDY